MSSALAGLSALALYLLFPSHRHNFDGVACAIAVELGDLKHLLHGNHLLYGPLGLAFHRLLALCGLNLSALWALQLLDSLLGAAGVGLLHASLRRAGASARAAAFCASGLALSYAWWLWSLEAQVYALGGFLLAGALREALRPGGPRPYALALWHGAAMLSHGANALWAPAALLALGRRREDAARYLLCATGLVLAGYAAAAAAIEPASLADLRLWLLGSAALGPGREFLWHGAGSVPEALRHWLETGLLAVSPSALLALPLWAAALWSLARRRGLPSTRLSWAWLAGYAPVFLAWEPYTLVYRMSDLPALWLAAAPAAERLWKPGKARALLLAWAAAFAAVNLRAVASGGRSGANAALQKALWIGANTPPEAWVDARGIDEVYLPYFAHRRTINVRHFPSLDARVRQLLARGERVFLQSPAPGLTGPEAARRGADVLYEVNGKPKGRM